MRLRYTNPTPTTRSLSNGKHLVSLKTSCCLHHRLCRIYDAASDYWHSTVIPFQLSNGRGYRPDEIQTNATRHLRKMNRAELVFCRYYDQLPSCKPECAEELLQYDAGRRLLDTLEPTVTAQEIASYSIYSK